MSSNSGANTRVSIPTTMRKTIQDIKEISGNHSDEDVYAMLKECSMDPNETAQRLLFLDTFHEVKRKRDKRKDNLNGRIFESPTRKPGNQGRGARSGRGSFSSQFKSHDAGGDRVAAIRKENGLEDKRERGLQLSSLPVLKEMETKPFPPISKTSIIPMNGPTCLHIDGLSNGHGHIKKNSETDNIAIPNHVKDVRLLKPETTPPQAKVNEEHAASADINLVSMQSRDSQISTAVGAEKSHDIAANLKDSVIADEAQTNQLGPGKVGMRELCSSRSENPEHSPVQPKMNGESLGTEKISFSPECDTVQSSLMNSAGLVKLKAVEDVSAKLNKLKFAEVQHVILPDHIQVPDAVKNVLSFGSLDARFGVGLNDTNSSVSNSNLDQASEFLEDGSAEEPESCEEGTPTAEEENYPNSPQDVPETISSPENNFSASQDDQVKQEAVPAVGPPYPIVQPVPAYGFGFMPPMPVSPLVQIEGLDHQARLLNTVIGNSSAIPTTSTPPLIQSPGAVQSNGAASAHTLPLIRQPYPPNFIPYTHYFPPFFMPPTLQFLGHGGFPPQFPTGNMYLPAAAAASGMKLSHSYKPGTNIMSQAPVGVPSGAFGIYGPPQVGYNPSAVVTSGGSNVNEDLVPAGLKENNLYIGQQSEGTPVWLPAPGRESASLPINPFFNVPLQSQHAFAAMYHPLQTVAAPTAAQPLVQQPESMAGSPEIVPPSFHQPPQHQQHMNWNGGF